MGSPLGPTMAKIFLSFYEVKWLEHCPKDFKPVITEDMLIALLFSSNRLNTSRNFAIIFILVIQTCLFPFNKKVMGSCHFLM